MSILIGQCDCCAREDRQLRRVWAYGLETLACWECLGDDEPENDDEDTPNDPDPRPNLLLGNDTVIER